MISTHPGCSALDTKQACSNTRRQNCQCTNHRFTGGENISSVALESMLMKHPDVLEAGVVAVADSHWGERPKAYVTVKQSSTNGNKKIEGRDVVEWARHQSQISRFMVPREVEVLDELPKTSTGKIRKNVLREWAKHGPRDRGE